jgi:hypothetical protein
MVPTFAPGMDFSIALLMVASLAWVVNEAMPNQTNTTRYKKFFMRLSIFKI